MFKPHIVLAACSTDGVGGTAGTAGAVQTNGGAGGAGACGTGSSGSGGGGGGGGSAAGGSGAGGAGGGLVLKNTSGSMTISGTIDARGGGSSTTNGGTVKLFYTGSAPATGGISSGRTYTAAATTQQSAVCVPTIAVDDSSVGTRAWVSPGGGLAQDTDDATSSGLSTSAISHYLDMTGCSFSIPSSATITGVRVDLYKNYVDNGDGDSVTDNSLKLIKGGVIGGSSLASASAWPTSYTWTNYGGATNLWGNTLAPSDVNSSNFGVALSANLPCFSSFGCSQAFLDATHITVYYTMSSSNSAPAAPTLVSPSNGATGIGLKPTLQLRTTDADSDYLEYKIQLCQDAACSTVLQTFDETSTQTGWSGQDANSGNAYVGSSTLTSSTIANYTLQSSLSQSTTYYWRGYGIDPGGTNGFGSASAIQSFTTGANSTPSAPSLVSPTSGATGTSTSPLLQVHSSDADGDYLRYKIIVYNSDCATNPQTFDETSTQTGWSGQDQQGGTAYTGSSVLGNSTIATYGSANLSVGTQYCWKAAAIDPGGSNTWSAFSSTQLFTTGSASGQVQLNGNTQIRGGTLIR